MEKGNQFKRYMYDEIGTIVPGKGTLVGLVAGGVAGALVYGGLNAFGARDIISDGVYNAWNNVTSFFRR